MTVSNVVRVENRVLHYKFECCIDDKLSRQPYCDVVGRYVNVFFMAFLCYASTQTHTQIKAQKSSNFFVARMVTNNTLITCFWSWTIQQDCSLLQSMELFLW